MHAMTLTLAPNALKWVHEISQSALAGAVLLLGVVVLLELRTVARMRRDVTRDLARVFEQLDLLQLSDQRLTETIEKVQAELPAAVVAALRAAAPTGAAPGLAPTRFARPQPAPVEDVRGLRGGDEGRAPAARRYETAAAVAAPVEQERPAGEARLLQALQSARVRRSA